MKGRTGFLLFYALSGPLLPLGSPEALLAQGWLRGHHMWASLTNQWPLGRNSVGSPKPGVRSLPPAHPEAPPPEPCGRTGAETEYMYFSLCHNQVLVFYSHI